MDIKELKGLVEAYQQVHVPQEETKIDEALTGERYKKVMKKPGGTAYSRKVSEDPSKRATRGGRGGESDFGAGDRGSGNKAARRAAALKNEELDIFDVVLEFLQSEGYAKTLEEAEWMMANQLDAEDIEAILEAEQLNELSNRKLRAYIKKSSKSHSEINKKWDQGTATEKEKLKAIGHEIGQERAYKKMDKRAGR